MAKSLQKPDKHKTGEQKSDKYSSTSNLEGAADAYMDDIALPDGTQIHCPENDMRYTILEQLGSGSFGNLYHVFTAAGIHKVLKEFCPEGSRRKRADLSLDMSTSRFTGAQIADAREKFYNEPMRVLALYKGGLPEARKVNDNMTYNEAYEAARAEFPDGCVFKWKGYVFHTMNNAQLDNLNVVLPVTECFELFNGNLYFIMDWVSGQNLYNYKFNPNTDKDIDTILRIMEQLSLAVCNIHEKLHCLHQDLSPGNIIIDINNSAIQLKVIDFGLAADLKKIREDIQRNRNNFQNQNLIGTYIVGGTPGFTDIFENLLLYKRNPGCIDLIDIYSLGAILYFLLFSKINTWNIDGAIDLKKGIEDVLNKQEKLEEQDSQLQRNRKNIINGCCLLIKNATLCTNTDFKGRISTAREFHLRIQELLYRLKWKDDRELVMDAAFGEKSLTFETTGPWEAEIEFPEHEENKWLDFEVKNVDNQNVTLNFKVEQNRKLKERKAVVKIKSGCITIYKTFFQKAAKRDYIKPRGSQTLIFNGEGRESQSMAFICNPAWNASVPDDVDWVKLEYDKGNAGDWQVRVSVTQPNASDTPRKAIVTVKAGTAQREWTIEQKEQNIIIPLGETKLSFSWHNAMAQAVFRCNGAWTATLVQGDGDWVTVTPTNGEAGQNSIALAITENDGYRRREALLRVTCGQAVVDYTIRQKAKLNPVLLKWLKWAKVVLVVGILGYAAYELIPVPPTILEVSSQQVTLNHEGGSDTVKVVSNKEWNAEIVEEQPEDWLKVIEAKDELRLTASKENTRYEPKTATIRLTAGDSIRLVTVRQDIDRIDSLNNALMQKKSGRLFNGRLSNDKLSFSVIDEHGKKIEYTTNELWDVVSKKHPNIFIGKTHKVYEFKEDSLGHITSITLKEIESTKGNR